jgi:hypothetical protein
MTTNPDPTVIATLNDALRAKPGPGWLTTRGVQAQGALFVSAAISAVTTFAAFNEGDDPYGERDFGAVMVGGVKLFWKIDYYDQTLAAASPDPADEAVTRRVLTLMLADEY